MIQKILIIMLLLGLSSSCKYEKQITKREQIKVSINDIGFIKLPLKFDANDESGLKSSYLVNRNSNDTLLFGTEIREIVGFLPDTTNYYAFLFFTIGDILYPTIKTMDKNWEEIDQRIICASSFSGLLAVDVKSCYDSVWIYKDLTIKSISKFEGTVETGNGNTYEEFDICNIITLEGFIDRNGKIDTKESDLKNCTESDYK